MSGEGSIPSYSLRHFLFSWPPYLRCGVTFLPTEFVPNSLDLCPPHCLIMSRVRFLFCLFCLCLCFFCCLSVAHPYCRCSSNCPVLCCIPWAVARGCDVSIWLDYTSLFCGLLPFVCLCALVCPSALPCSFFVLSVGAVLFRLSLGRLGSIA